MSLRNSVQFERPMSKVALSPAGDRIAIITENRQMLIWEAASERVAWEMDADSACTSATWSGDGQRLMTFGWEGWVTVWQADSGQVIHRWRIDSQIFPAAKLSSDGRLAAVSEVSRIRIWDVETGQVHSEIPGHDDVISALVFADEDRALFFGDLKGRLQRWSVTDQREVWAVP